MSKIWEKDSKQEINTLVEKFTVGDDYILDKQLMLFDIQASKAHAKMLCKIGILTAEELRLLLEGLSQLEIDWQAGKVEIKIQDEDCHTVIENYLIENFGEVGKKIHTGRSRNDQVLVVLRLYMKENIDEIVISAKELAKTFLDSAKAYKQVPLPGYSHTQQAMLSSVEHYFCSFVESLVDDIKYLKLVKKHTDKNPLGSAAGFGVSIPLDREFTTHELGFASVQTNSLYCQNSRGKFESLFLEGLVQIMMTLNKFASDIILFTSQEFNFFDVDGNLVTGSSIMPQKKNFDVLEILRGQTSVVQGNQQIIKDLSKNLISGYNRDFQLIKKPLFESVKIVKNSLQVIKIFIRGIKPNKDNIEAKITKELFMADVANKLVTEAGMPFREAYRQAQQEIKSEKIDFQENIESKISLGAPGNLGIEYYEQKLA